MAVSFANIFMASVETEIINSSHLKPLTWKRFIDDVFFSTKHKQRGNKHAPGVRKGFIKSEALRLRRANSSKATFEEKRHYTIQTQPDYAIEVIQITFRKYSLRS